MLDSRAKEVVRMGDSLFAAKRTIDSLWQELAENFYPARATFTTTREQGEEYADHLFSSYPNMARRELGNMLDEFLFPDKFFAIHVDDEDLDERDEERAYLEKLTNIQYRAMMDQPANFVRARGQTNHDISAFGNGVIEFGLNVAGDGFLFTNYHLRDCAWAENAEGKVDCNHRNWEPTAKQLYHYFPKTISKEVRKACGLDGEGGSGKDPEKIFKCRRVVLPSRLYHYKTKGGKEFPFVSLYVECETETVLEERGLTHFCYNIPRWQLISGSAYATSMATDVALPDGRTMQVVMRTLREAGEMHVNPPMLAQDDVIRGDMGLYAGGVTLVDRDYDERLGEALRPLTRDRGGFPIGEKIAQAIKDDLRTNFLLDKFNLPETYTGKMTATEIRRRTQEFIRSSKPIAKPLQNEYGPLLEGVFQILKEQGVFKGIPVPRSISEKEVKFQFRSPLDDLVEQNDAEIYVDVLSRIIAPGAQADPNAIHEFDFVQGTKDAARAAGWKAKWMKKKEVVEAERQAAMEAMQAQKMAAAIGEAAAIAQQGGKGVGEIAKASQILRQPAPAPAPARRFDWSKAPPR